MGASSTQKNAENQQNQIAGTDVSRSTNLYNQSQAGYNQASSLLNPGISFYSGLASGDPTKISQTAAPLINNIAKSTASAQGAISDSLPAGAARNFALASVKRDQAGQTAGALNQSFLSAFPALSGISGQVSGMAGQQLSGSTGYQSGAQSATQSVLNTEAQKRQSKLQTIGSFAGLAGGAIPGLSSLFGGSGVGNTSSLNAGVSSVAGQGLGINQGVLNGGI